MEKASTLCKLEVKKWPPGGERYLVAEVVPKHQKGNSKV